MTTQQCGPDGICMSSEGPIENPSTRAMWHSAVRQSGNALVGVQASMRSSVSAIPEYSRNQRSAHRAGLDQYP